MGYIKEDQRIVCFLSLQACTLQIVWTSIAIAIAGVMIALKNEIIFLDHLTGLYNRVYLEFLQKQDNTKKDAWVSGIMIDLNGFKQIKRWNDGKLQGVLSISPRDLMA